MKITQKWFWPWLIILYLTWPYVNRQNKKVQYTNGEKTVKKKKKNMSTFFKMKFFPGINIFIVPSSCRAIKIVSARLNRTQSHPPMLNLAWRPKKLNCLRMLQDGCCFLSFRQHYLFTLSFLFSVNFYSFSFYVESRDGDLLF